MNKDTDLKIRKTLNFFFSFFMIVLISPVLLMIAIAIKLEDKGSVFIMQESTGSNGNRFPIYKFRTMRASPVSEMISLSGGSNKSGPVFKIRNDPKVTRVGRLLRKTSFDELPHFFNVIHGEMPLVAAQRPIPSGN